MYSVEYRPCQVEEVMKKEKEKEKKKPHGEYDPCPDKQNSQRVGRSVGRKERNILFLFFSFLFFLLSLPCFQFLFFFPSSFFTTFTS